jgi:hypothetical protein
MSHRSKLGMSHGVVMSGWRPFGELVTFLGFHGSLSAKDTAAFTRAPKAAQLCIIASMERDLKCPRKLRAGIWNPAPNIQ